MSGSVEVPDGQKAGGPGNVEFVDMCEAITGPDADENSSTESGIASCDMLRLVECFTQGGGVSGFESELTAVLKLPTSESALLESKLALLRAEEVVALVELAVGSVAGGTFGTEAASTLVVLELVCLLIVGRGKTRFAR